MWKTFFEVLGAETVISEPTTRAMLSAGSARVVAETCMPVKVCMGHVLTLIEQCDYLFIPAIRSMENRVHNCSKFLGLPDMTKAVIPQCPPILDITIDVAKGKRDLYQAIYSLGRRFTRNPLKVKAAAEAAWQAHLDYQRQMCTQGLTPLQALGDTSDPTLDKEEENGSAWGKVAIIGHPYLIYDEYVNYRLTSRLKRMGLRVFTSEMVSEADLEAAVVRIAGGSYWTYEKEVVGAGGYYLENNLDGVIGVIAFGCGPDSLMMDMVQRHAKRLKATPFMVLTLDEHTAETGLVTRLEAFVDMIKRRKRDKVTTCA